ncbi:hypothetical protein B0H11DRAFT_1902564 [Mycena galericulata]|nr:hypothetical protein B0H11DRAFT_1925699 [Mycena galericulata]KAJ7508246.1 hypothetical protein B0H11DRAFT_1902564 [Mycena galericulata]
MKTCGEPGAALQVAAPAGAGQWQLALGLTAQLAIQCLWAWMKACREPGAALQVAAPVPMQTINLQNRVMPHVLSPPPYFAPGQWQPALGLTAQLAIQCLWVWMMACGKPGAALQVAAPVPMQYVEFCSGSMPV